MGDFFFYRLGVVYKIKDYSKFCQLWRTELTFIIIRHDLILYIIFMFSKWVDFLIENEA